MEDKKYQKFPVSSELIAQIAGEIARAKSLTGVKDIEIAKRLGKTRQNYSRMIINGMQQIGNVEAIANALGFDVEIKFIPKSK